MHCVSCGTALVEGAVFCKRCGTAAAAMRGASAAPSSEKLAELTICFAVMTGVVGLGGLLSISILVYKLMTRPTDPNTVALLALAGFAATVLLTWLLARQSSRVLDAYLRPYVNKDVPVPELPARDTAQLEAPREPVPSATEHTTRTFDPIHVEHARRQ